MEVLYGMDKDHYLNLLQSVVNIDLINRDYLVNIFSVEFSVVNEYDFEEVGEEDFFQKYINNDSKSEYIIIPLEEDYPAFYFNSDDWFQEYSEVINYPKIEDLGKHAGHALTIVCEVFFIMDIERRWCIYLNRYFDKTQVAFKY